MMNIFTQHPKSINESYLEHFKHASWFGINMLLGGLACLIHAIFPFLFIKTGSDILIKTVEKFIARMPVAEPRFIALSQSIEKKRINPLPEQYHEEANQVGQN